MVANGTIFSTSEAAFAVDHKGRIVAWNQAAERAFGFLESEAVGKNCWKLLSGRDIFHNRSCCQGCPIRNTAFEHELINRFQVDFNTAAEKRQRFTVSTLLLHDGPDEEVLVHLCHPETLTDSHAVNHQDYRSQNHLQDPLSPREKEVLELMQRRNFESPKPSHSRNRLVIDLHHWNS